MIYLSSFPARWLRPSMKLLEKPFVPSSSSMKRNRMDPSLSRTSLWQEVLKEVWTLHFTGRPLTLTITWILTLAIPWTTNELCLHIHLPKKSTWFTSNNRRQEGRGETSSKCAEGQRLPWLIFTENGSDLSGPQHQSGSQQQPKGFCVLPFVRGVSQGIGKVLKLAGVRLNF